MEVQIVVGAGGAIVVEMGFGVDESKKRQSRPHCCALSRAFHLRSKSVTYSHQHQRQHCHFLHDHVHLL